MYSLRCYTFKFIHVATSGGINKAITRENDCLPFVYFVLLLLAFRIGGSRTSLTFKMEFILTIVDGRRLLLLLQRVPSYMLQGSQIRLSKSIGKLRKTISTSTTPVLWFHRILFHHAFTENHLSFQSCCID